MSPDFKSAVYFLSEAEKSHNEGDAKRFVANRKMILVALGMDDDFHTRR